MTNKLIHSFLQDPEHQKLYSEYLQNPDETNKELIESKFRLHVMKIKILSYFSKVISYEAQRFDRKIRTTSTLPLLGDDNEEYPYMIDEPQETFTDPFLENHFENERLYNIVSNLNDDNKKLLYLLYVKDLDEAQTAERLGITQQGVNKRKNNLLKKIRKLYFD